MTTSSGIDEATLSVLLDIRHPQAYLALQPAMAFAEELGTEINWLPLRVPPLKAPTTPGLDDDRGVRHKRQRTQAIAREIDVYSAAQGLVLRELHRDPDPSAFNLAWLWHRERDPKGLEPFLTEAFRAYWALELDPASEVAVASLIESLGRDGAGFRSWASGAGRSAAAELADELRDRGLFGVPGYVVGDEVFLGRQHLPMIRWILEGRKGPGPI
jgi:2-hydroxychromene-2-carboxylate isomerase